jgi:putative transposase
MSKKRTQYTAEFKTQVVLELLSGDWTVNQVAVKYGVLAKNLLNWKKQFLENASLAFDPAKAVKDYKDEIEELKSQNAEYAKKVGQLTLERDFLEGKLVSSVSSSDRRGMIETGHDLPIVRQCELLHITRSTHYYKPVPVCDTTLMLMRRIDEIYTERSTLGYRQIYSKLQEEGFTTGLNRVGRLMNEMGLQAVFPKKRRSRVLKEAEGEVYPYLLSELHNDKKQVVTTHANQVWSGDITYIPMKHGFMYLAAIIDWHTKAILSYRLSNAMDASLVTTVLNEAIARYGTPEIFNSDQGSQYKSKDHTQILMDHGIRISMNGKGRSIDNIAIERFFKTLKYDEIYLNDYANVAELRKGIDDYMRYYNFNRFHSAIGYQKPMNLYLEAINNKREEFKNVA